MINLALGASPAAKKGVSISHLLEFSHGERPKADKPHGRAKHSQSHHASRPRRRVFQTDTFVQANCTFRVRAHGDYSVCVADPDHTVEWDDIVEVSMPTAQAPKCPICLAPPVAPRITRCGHIYCWHCMLHHLACGETNDCNKCPLCENFVYDKDLRFAAWDVVRRPSAGDHITMQLMKCDKGSTLAVRAADWPSLPSTLKGVFASTALHKGCFRILPISSHEILHRIIHSNQEQIQQEISLGFEDVAYLIMALQRSEQLAQKLCPGGASRPTRNPAAKAFNPAAKAFAPAVASPQPPAPAFSSGPTPAQAVRREGWGAGEAAALATAGSAATAAAGSPADALMETRVDVSDGVAYPLDSFVEVYGGSRAQPPQEWADAKRAGATRAQQGPREGGGKAEVPTADVARAAATEGDPDLVGWRGGHTGGNCPEQPDAPGQWMQGNLVPSSHGGWATQTLAAAAPAATEGAKTPSVPRPGAQRAAAKLPGGSSSATFLQAADGQATFVHPFNIMCLEWEFGSLDQCPQTVEAKIIDLEQDVVTEENRRRYRFLRHLPLMRAFSRVELDLSKLLSAATKAHFKAESDRRQQQRKKRAFAEKRQNKLMQQRGDQMEQEHRQYFAAHANVSEMTDELKGWLSASTQAPSDGPIEPEDEFASFSQMVGAREPGTIMNDLTEWAPLSTLTASPPETGGLQSEDAEQPRSKMVTLTRSPTKWGTAAPSAPVPIRRSNDPEAGDDRTPPSHQATFFEDLSGALDRATLDGGTPEAASKKTKNKKKKTLISMTGGGGARNY